MNLTQSSRFKDAPWFPQEETHVVVGGAGGIGSWLSLLLARGGFTPIVYDFDHIEEHNIGGQLFSKKDIDAPKVTALSRIVKEFADTDIMGNNEKYTSDTMSHSYVFSAFDNMQARKDMFNNWKEFVAEWKEEELVRPIPVISYSLILNNGGSNKLSVIKFLKETYGLGLKETKEQIDTVPSLLSENEDKDPLEVVKLALEELGAVVDLVSTTIKDYKVEEVRSIPIFIDGRLLMEQLTIFCVTPDNMEKYEAHLFDDKDVPPEPCTLKQTSHSAAMIASHMMAFFTNHFANVMVGEDDRTVPFRWEYFIPINYLNEE